MGTDLCAIQRDTDSGARAGGAAARIGPRIERAPRRAGRRTPAATRRASARAVSRAVVCAALCAAAGPLSGAERSVFDWGYALRVRQEYIRNGFDLSSASADDWNSIRVRSQLRGAYLPREGWKLQAVLNNEHRHWFRSTGGQENEDFEIDELIVESLFLQGRRIGGTPFGFTAGRQNLFYGEGLVCWDAGPLDGSRTAYFNALLLHAEFDRRRLDVHVASNPRRDDYLPVVNDLDRPLIERDERGGGAYYVDESFAGRTLEAYYFFKNEKGAGPALPAGDTHTLGVRASGAAVRDVTFGLEWAAQFGEFEAARRRACGGYLYGTWRAPLKRALEFSLGGLYLSGDDPDTDGYEGWNPLYARWPKWSELYIYTLARERGVAYWENLSSGWCAVKATPREGVIIDARLYLMWALEHTPAPADPLFGGGNYRGTLATVKVDWKLHPSVSGHLLWEVMRPGDYYAGGSDRMHFLRWEIYYRR